MCRYSTKQCILALRKEGCNTERYPHASEALKETLGLIDKRVRRGSRIAARTKLKRL